MSSKSFDNSATLSVVEKCIDQEKSKAIESLIELATNSQADAKSLSMPQIVSTNYFKSCFAYRMESTSFPLGYSIMQR